MSVAVKTIPNSTATIAIGSCSGRLTYQNLRRPVAPSTDAASCTSFGIDAIPAMKITVANGRIRHEWTEMIEIFASVVLPTQFGGLVAEQLSMFARWQNGVSRCVLRSAQFTIEKVGSRIQVKAIVVSATGAAHGSRISRRRNHLPRKSRTS